MNQKYDIIVIGGGHAGLEACNAACNIGCKVALLTMSKDTLCKPSCNPSIGGTAKGHIVKEIDALGGLMGKIADKCGIHFKMLNKSKGPAVWSPRCQIDKELYPKIALDYLEKIPNLDIITDQAVEIIIENKKVVGVLGQGGKVYDCISVVFTPGTFLNGSMFTGFIKTKGGRYGEPNCIHISTRLQKHGIVLGRLKTGTPPRVYADSINYMNVMKEQGDTNPVPFSFYTKKVYNKIECYLTATTLETHNILREGFDRSPMFQGQIKGVGPRYCPSIEDKINRFADHDSHKIVLEPEGMNNESVYVNGFSTSMPLDIQIRGLKSIPGLEDMRLMRAGYAIEYDYIPSYQIKYTLETKMIENLYLAGQVNGSSGYEEAAGQGLVAGANAALKVLGRDPFILKRNEAYIGVLIDDLVNKYSDEPYRMFTSLAEYRLLLRQDNAGQRLFEKAYAAGLIDETYYIDRKKEKEAIEYFSLLLKDFKMKPEKVNPHLEQIGEAPVTSTTNLYTLLKRSNVHINDLFMWYNGINYKQKQELLEQVEFNIKYEGYIKRQLHEVEYFNENENKRIPENFDYDKVKSLSREAHDKLVKIRPTNFGQLSRIPGVSATDISIIAVFLKQ